MAELLLQETLTQADIEELQDTGVAISAKFRINNPKRLRHIFKPSRWHSRCGTGRK
jgi:hypothetical protein